VKHGLAEENTILDSRAYGISIGHRDTDNVIRGNRIERSGQTGILFRAEPNEGRCPHRNLVERNRILDSGSETPSYAVDIQGETCGIKLRGNQLVETRGPTGRVGVRIGSQARDVVLDANEFSGLETAVLRC
jgi:Right handed beta helix region